jgi:DNA polymerase-3 subunit beta
MRYGASMRLRCDSVQLAAALTVVARALPSRSVLPVLGTILLEAENDGLTLTATNLELTIERRIAADVDEDGSVAVPGRLLADFASALPAEQLHLETSGQEHRLRLHSDSFRTEIHGIPPDEFPPVPADNGAACLPLPAARLVGAINDTLPASSTDESRPVLTGVHVQVDPGRLRLIATDGHRLALSEVPLEPDHGLVGIRVTIPARTLNEVARLFRAADGDVRIGVAAAGNQVFFHGTGIDVTSRVVDGAFPDHRRLVPDRATTVVTVSALELEHRLRALAPFAQNSAHVVRLEVARSTLTLAATATDVGAARTDLEVRVDGPEQAIAFNSRYLLDCPALAADQSVELHLHGPLGPIAVRRTTADGSVYLFMPVRHFP